MSQLANVNRTPLSADSQTRRRRTSTRSLSATDVARSTRSECEDEISFQQVPEFGIDSVQDTTDNSTQQLQELPAASQMCLAAIAVFLLAVGGSLQVYLLARVSQYEQDSKHKQNSTDEKDSKDSFSLVFVISNWYNIICMLLSILWMTITGIAFVNKRNSNNFLRTVQRNCLKYDLSFFAVVAALLTLGQLTALFICKCSHLSIAYAFIKFVFIIFQTVFIVYCCKYPLFSNQFAHGCCLYLTVVTNVLLYLTTFLETKILFAETETESNRPNENLNLLCLISSSCNEKPSSRVYKTANVYLFPFFLEFTLTSSAMLAQFWIAAKKFHEPTSASHANFLISYNTDRKLTFRIGIGIAVGVVMLCSVAVVVLLILNGNFPVYLFQIFNTSVSLFSIVLFFHGIRCLASNDTKESNIGLDEVLLIISVFGVFGLCISGISSSVCFLQDQIKDAYAWLKLTTSVIWVPQAVVQSYFIAMALHRKPGISNITIKYMAIILAAINFGMWFLDTMDLGRHYRSFYSQASIEKLNEVENNLFGQAMWTWIVPVFYPFAIFFRIQSALALCRVFKLHN